MGKSYNLSGKVFGRLTAIKIKEHRPWKGALWECICECGNKKDVLATKLYRGNVKSCGCLRVETAITNGKKVRIASSSGKWKGFGDLPMKKFNGYKLGAEKRNLEFSITIEQAWVKFLDQNSKCAITGLPLSFGKTSRNSKENTASLDRIDSSIGYTIENIHWVHKNINRMKGTLPMEEFVDWCRLIVENNIHTARRKLLHT